MKTPSKPLLWMLNGFMILETLVLHVDANEGIEEDALH